ncbi:hypothetical protein BJF83_17525 [Nocardiopsis sp. CNR-923]|uniref:recombinase family protein n=1 Tax=Nocardiopsis sp. CNR-923 TaxID=1904965 RepID=UPI000969891D|nr:recombinase family protein [Nocardiopsis sp. CNR-923]OLT27784.1 hypothetical protein BJF83_17525 [Nocardiopsis sp. CNR-923]
MAVAYDIDLDALLITHGGDPLGTIPMIGYIRVSTAREDMISPEMQADHINELGKRTGCRIVRWVADLDLSGRTLAKRQISAIIESIANGTSPEGARKVGVWKYSRFGRNRADNQLNLALLERNGGELLSATEQVDATTAVGKLTRGVLLELAAFESDLIGEGWRDVHAHRIARGLPHTGIPRFAYDRLGKIKIGGTWVHDPADPLGERYALGDTSPQLARMYREAAEGAPIGGIARWLNHERVPSTLGNIGRWLIQSTYAVLDSGFGCGVLVAHDPRCTGHPSSETVQCPNKKEYPGAHPHVFDDDDERDAVWEAFKDRRRTGKKKGRRAANPRYDWTGIIKCRWCDRHLGAQPRYGSPHLIPQWRCMPDKVSGCPRPEGTPGTSVAGGRVLYAVWDLLTRERARLDELAGAVESHTAQPPAVSAKAVVEDLQARLKRARDTLDGLAVKHALGDIKDDVYRRTRDKTEQEEAALAQELAQAKAQAKQKKRPEEYLPVMRELLDEWPTLPVWSRNRMVGELVEMEAWRVDSEQAWLRISTAWGVEEIAAASGRLPESERAVLQEAKLIV